MSPPLHSCNQVDAIAAIRRKVDTIEETIPNFDALLPELGKIHESQGEIAQRLTGIEVVLEGTVGVVRNLTDELSRLTPEVHELASWRGEGQTREIEALRAAVREQERENARREVAAERGARERTKLRYRLAQAVILAVISAASVLAGRACGIHESAAPAAMHSK